MNNQTQYGNTILMADFESGSSAEILKRLHFTKSAPDKTRYDEEWLQHFIMRHPSVLPVDQIEPVFTPLVPICTELPMNNKSLDNLLVTPSGDLALIECKLWRNPQARREVIAQIIDYAKEMSTWSYEQLQEAISLTKPLEGQGEAATRNLYDLVSPDHQIDEVSFHDAVSRNLKRGRFLLLIIGDGIREGIEGMADFLQQHAGFHFTLGFVELALFEMSDKRYLVQPRVIARTTNINRGIVTLEDGGWIKIMPPSTGSPLPNGSRQTSITQERYFEQIEMRMPGISARLNVFLEDLAPYGVSPDFGVEAIILRWHSDDGKGWNLGLIATGGFVHTDSMGWQANSEGLIKLYKQYLQELANLVPGAIVMPSPKEATWRVSYHGKTVTVDVLLADDDRKKGWIEAITAFQAGVRSRLESN